ncbi:hypothetical protein ACFQ3N_19095 [Virgibacillus byunsanensis]|uniref:GNAT family N-acetyltransferase n=1 Tax=Virgibacillus byunsanensis TaxID=570945 RepID=A0ABW3LQ41_9BACI
MEIRQLIPNDAEKYFNLRLEALQRNLEAFSSTYEEEKDYSLEKYQNRFKDDYFYTFGAFENEQLLGVVSLVMEQIIAN